MKFRLIQVLRGAAALVVICYHLLAHLNKSFNDFRFNETFKFGLVGVDFFFVLSGFIITYVHYKDLVAGTGLANFFKKRFIRIYPLYWVIAIISVAIFVFMTPNRLKDQGLSMDLSSPYILGSLLQSFLLIPQKGMYLVGVAWTLSYEVLFYLLFGLCIKLGYRFAKGAMLMWFILIVLNAVLLQSANFYIQFLLNPVIVEFMMGCLVAYALIHQLKIPQLLLYALFVLLVTASVSFIHFDGLRLERTIWYELLLGALFSIITYLAVKTDIKYPHIKYPAILLLLGDASYSIYLFHQTLYNVFVRLYQKALLITNLSLPVMAIATGILVLTLMAGVLIHLFIEKKMLQYLQQKFIRGSKKTVVPAAAV
jgi:exopolysaccharide production protein ExoZ